MRDANEQSLLRNKAEENLRLLMNDYAIMQRDMPPFQVDSKEIGVLRQLKGMGERDKMQLMQQNE